MRPESEAELAEMIKTADGPLSIRGGATRGVLTEGTPIETGGLSGISLYDPGALTLVVKAGTPLADIETALDAEGQRLPFEPMDHRGLLGTSGAPTIGGIAAGNISGPRRIQAGACRDLMLGVRFVDGQGTVVKNGGRVMKNVTGYDLVKLMAGSWGSLGALTEVSFKVLPTPEATATVILTGLSDEDAVSAMSKALGSPFDVTGAAHISETDPADAKTMIRIEGFEGSVTYRAGVLRDLFKAQDVTVETDPTQCAALWSAIRDVEPLQDRTGDVWKVSCKPSDGPELARRLQAEAVMYDWGGGLIWACLPEGTDARTRLGAFGGHATLVRGTAKTPRFHPEPAVLATLSQGLRDKFDPRGILNPRVMTG